jgi:hypothetical protein
MMNGLKKCGIYTIEFYSSIKNEILSFTGKWMELENIMLSEVRLRSSKGACSPSYAIVDLKKCSSIMGQGSH